MSHLPRAFLRAPIAHRAYHDIDAGRPENSRASIEAAIEAGYGIEIDIQPSADGRAMVFHDETLERLTGHHGNIRYYSAEALGRIGLLGGDEGIPTLAEVLELVAGRVPLLIEIKDQDGALGPNVGPLEDAVAAELESYAGDVALMSFNPHSVAALAAAAPERPRGLTTCAFDSANWPELTADARARLRGIEDFTRTGARFISHDWHDLINPRVTELKAAGAGVLCWTVRSPEEEAEARRVAQNVTFEGYAAVLPRA
ncbi:MAG: glycerophosphodiester phosphodiesterase family protein [Paracoccaceae bacterium]